MSASDPANQSSGNPGSQGTASTPSTVTYAGNVEQTDEARAQAQVAQDPLSRGVTGAVFGSSLAANAKSRADKAAGQYAASQAQRLGHEITTKAGPHTGGHNYLSYQQDELHQMVNSNADPESVNAQGQTYTDIGNDFAELTDALNKAVSTASVAWQGKAAAGGASFTTAMSSWHGSTAQGAQYAGTQMFEQSQALSQARASMPPPVATPTVGDLQHALMTYNPLDSASINTLDNLANQYDVANSNHQVMARVAQQYDAQLGSSATLPAFSAPAQFNPNQPAPAGNSSSGATAGASGTGSGATSMKSAHGLSGASVGAASGYAGSGASGGRAGSIPPTINPGQSAASGQGTPSQVPDGSTTAQGAGNYYPPTSTGQGAGGPGPSAGAGPMGGGGTGSPYGAAPVGGAFGPVGGNPSYGGGGSGWGSTGSRIGGGPGGSVPGQGGTRSGVGAGANAAEESALEGSAAGARGSATGAAGGLGGGRGRGSEDREHRRPEYLMESDPDSIFGTDEKTIPPVLGLE
jgi:hypothetical protein